VTDLYILNALRNFKCIGSDCPRTCCGEGWNIEIEEDLQKKWNSLADQADRSWLQAGITKSPDKPLSILRMRDTGNCVFLNDQKLCAVQNKYGHEFIPRICQNYPRVEFETPQRIYKTASLSCPEIVRLLFADNEDNHNFISTQSQTTSNIVFHESKLYYEVLLELDNILRDILSSTQIKRGVRIFFISVVFSEAYKQLMAQKLTPRLLEQTRANLQKNLSEINAAYESKMLKPDPVTAGSFWKVVSELCQSRNINPKFRESPTNPLTSAMLQCNGSHEDFVGIHQIIVQYADQGRKILNERFGGLFEKYLSSYFAANGFPISFRSDALDIMLVQAMVGLCLLQLLLWMQINSGVEVNQQLLEETIVDVHRRYVHSYKVTDHLKQDAHMRRISEYCACFLDLF